ncbi:hypothetical protein GUITHDRAFT_137610 [Guillardia theta CCMP2712]|uniref:Uncharacterized protein n=1 Tax=Guillardia theta (strain CCMP2712) TaxID=905079 RepID=L1JGK6_GUITC|nr:hypothetical protein GUITHDRAFT_137610 [Guillardia theta CCMP2712]EKX47452.1 hypothetical protein GUITHDRAFT_137610 [Guillardia theta CCMP2712]|eukprot:XP_005834432.1 hypothetical protein GUITHDRAFT_137610 [Guillardia theta CCMP2712]
MASNKGVEHVPLLLLLLLCRARVSQNLLVDMARSSSSRLPVELPPNGPSGGRLKLRGGGPAGSTWGNVSWLDQGCEGRAQAQPTLRMWGGVRRISEDESDTAPALRGLPQEDRQLIVDGQKVSISKNGTSHSENATSISVEGYDAAKMIYRGVEEEVPIDYSILRTLPCSGDAWAGIFFDVEAANDVEINAIGIASHVYRLEPHVSVRIFYCNGSSIGKEVDLTQWECVFFAPNCSLPKVSRFDNHTEEDSPYAHMQLSHGIPLKSTEVVGFAVYTNSFHCVEVTGSDHPFDEVAYDAANHNGGYTSDENVRAFVGEVVYTASS